MDNNNSEHPCIFQWNIANPFLPWEPMEATFYSNAVTVIKWTVTIWPMGRGLSNWIFLFSLRAEEFSEFDVIPTHRVQIEISINGKRAARERLPYYCFEDSNHHTYQFLTHAGMRPKYEMPVLVVKVEIYLPVPPINPRAIALQEDLLQLSEDFLQLDPKRIYFNMKLLPDDDEHDGINVHSCIIDARWNNFFRIHSFINDNQVEINISEPFLRLILQYIYSGQLCFTWPVWEEVTSMATLFQVIDRYKLYHLYKIYVKNDSEQLRHTTKDLDMCRLDLTLDGFHNWLEIVPIVYHEDVLFILEMRISRDQNEIRLSYGGSRVLIPNIRRRIHFQVNVQFVKQISRPGHRNLRRIRSLHEEDYDVGPYEIVQSEQVIIPLNGPIFEDYILNITERGSRRIAHFLKCIFYLSDGTSLMRVQNISDDTIQNSEERFRDLADDMQKLLITQRDSDLRITCRNKEKDLEFHRAHKAIFATRVPKYWRVLQNVRRQGEIPDFVTCPFSSEAFRHILIYIYTGKILAFPFLKEYIDEVTRFAQQSEFIALINLINRMRGR